MNHTATSREELLRVSLHLAAQEGLSALNIRRIAGEAGISVGCVYRYFPTKAELMAATVEKVWESIFHRADGQSTPQDFLGRVRELYSCMQGASAEFPSFFSLHALSFDAQEKAAGRAVMGRYLSRLQQGLQETLIADPQVRKDLFDPRFSPEVLAGFVLQNLEMLAGRGAPDCETLIFLLQKLLYAPAQPV